MVKAVHLLISKHFMGRPCTVIIALSHLVMFITLQLNSSCKTERFKGLEVELCIFDWLP